MTFWLQQSNETGWNVQYLHVKSFVAYFFISLLKKVGYFGADGSDDKSKLTRDEMFMAEVLMQLMNISSTNALENAVYGVREKISSIEGDTFPVGGSLLPCLVLLNHSCDPNTVKINCNGHTILMANRTIEEGEEVTNYYYMVFAEAELADRQKYLMRKYCFQCDCEACTANWPTAGKLPVSFDDLRDGQMMFDFGDTVKLMQQVTKIQKLGSSISQEQKGGNFKKAFGLCIEFVKTLQDTIRRPHAYYLMAGKSLFKLGWILHGTIHR